MNVGIKNYKTVLNLLINLEAEGANETICSRISQAMNLLELDLTPFAVSFSLAFWATTILLIISFPLAWIFAFSRKRWIPFVEAFFSLGLVLPPTVMGFYLLVFFSPLSPFGGFLEQNFGLRLVFSFPGLVMASCISGLPFMVSALKTGLAGVPRRLMEASWTLGKSPLETLFRVILPQIKVALLAGVVSTFAHTLGEFGIVLMIGGSLPGVTKVVSIAIFEEVESGRLANAHAYSLLLILLSYLGTLALLTFQRMQNRGKV